MQKFSYETQGNNTYLTYSVGDEEKLDSMSLGMLTHNKIPGLAPTSFTQVDTQKYIKYNISAKISIQQLFNGPVNRKRLLKVFSGIIDGVISSEEYMIDEKSLVLDTEYIFADVSTCDTVLICLPVDNLEEDYKLGDFFKKMMFSTQFDQSENCEHVAQIINYLNSAPTFSPNDFKQLLDKLGQEKPAVKPAQQPPQKLRPAAEVAKPVQQPAPRVVQPVVEQPVAPLKESVPVSGPAPVPSAARKCVAVPQPSAAEEEEPEDDEKMSLIYLLRHYDKENAAIYKAQKEAEKAKKETETKGKNDKKAASDKKEKKGKKKSAENMEVSYAVPGAPASDLGFSIPGKSADSVQSVVGKHDAKPQTTVKNQPVVSAPSQTVNRNVELKQPVYQAAAPSQAVRQTTTASAAPARTSVPVSGTISFGETTVLSSANPGETTVLGAENAQAQIRPHLVRQKNNEKILVNKPVFRIGKEKSYVDYFIGDNSAISRSHANIITRDDGYYIVDTNSTNHTYVNGSMIQSNDEVPIEHGTIIGLANEGFEFRLY